MDLLIFQNVFAKIPVKEKGPLCRRAFFRSLECDRIVIHILDKLYIYAQAEKGICL